MPALVKRGANKLAQEVATEVVTDLIEVTPVDTSNALSNWQVRLGNATRATIEPYFPGIFGSTHGQSTNAATLAALAVIQGKKPGKPLYISNNVDYIEKLNAGSSRQAPAGFVQISILKGRRKLRSSTILGGMR